MPKMFVLQQKNNLYGFELEEQCIDQIYFEEFLDVLVGVLDSTTPITLKKNDL